MIKLHSPKIWHGAFLSSYTFFLNGCYVLVCIDKILKELNETPSSKFKHYTPRCG